MQGEVFRGAGISCRPILADVITRARDSKNDCWTILRLRDRCSGRGYHIQVAYIDLYVNMTEISKVPICGLLVRLRLTRFPMVERIQTC